MKFVKCASTLNRVFDHILCQ